MWQSSGKTTESDKLMKKKHKLVKKAQTSEKSKKKTQEISEKKVIN